MELALNLSKVVFVDAGAAPGFAQENPLGCAIRGILLLTSMLVAVAIPASGWRS
jgi:hypothetical protein